FDGHALQGVPPHRVAHLGMVRTFQLTQSLARLTALENVKLGATGQRGERFWAGLLPPLWGAQEREIEVPAEEPLVRLKPDQLRGEFAGSLSGGQRKLLEMARALMVDPKMVMLDEPMAGVNPALTQSLLEHIKDLREEGMTVMFAEHDMDDGHDISDWVAGMGEGRIIAEGTPDQISANPQVIDAYLGAHHDAPLTEAEEAAWLAEAEAAIEAEEREEEGTDG